MSTTSTMDGGRMGRFSKFVDGRVPQRTRVKRFDGAMRTSSSNWDNLRRDSELCQRSGNCLVYLYGRGQSRRGPAFKIPFSLLLTAQCHRLIERFAVWEGPNSPASLSSDCSSHTYTQFEFWNHLNPTSRVELYIPPPRGADKEQAFRYHLATRNFFAWVCRRSLVGDTLGEALVGLLNSMHEFRVPGQDNVADMIDYMEEEGYLDMRNQPDHALAVVRLAETFHLRGMYIDSFAHCTGMSNHLHLSPEYKLTSNVTKKLIRQARSDLEIRLVQASKRLRTFLEEELSDAHLGLPPGARTHMERFRSFLLSFYTTKLGYYPPTPVNAQTGVFDKHVYDIMRDDFECLHELLVDEDFTSAENSPFLAHGGICVVQNVHAFDLRCGYKSLEHPLPLLPGAETPSGSKRMSWFGRPNKLKPDNRLVSYTALAKATNDWKTPILKNDLVRAYRVFEEDSVICPSRVDRREKLSLADARKVRWILTYAIYQVLRNVTEPPREVCEIEDIDYHVAISCANLPPWKEGQPVESLVRRQTEMAALPLLPDVPTNVSAPPVPEIKPDVDYFALTHKSVKEPSKANLVQPTKTRARSLTRNFPRTNKVFRRSLSVFGRTGQTRPTTPATTAPKYHEIVVQGYGNGTNPVRVESKTAIESIEPVVTVEELEPESQVSPVDGDVGSMATRSLSQSSKASSNADSNSRNSTATSTTSADASPPSPDLEKESIPASLNQKVPDIISPNTIRGRRRTVVSMMQVSERTHSLDNPRRRPMSVHSHSMVPEYARDYADLVEEQHEEFEREEMQPDPLRIQKRAVSLHLADLGAWGSFGAPKDGSTEWENYSGLGGHVEVAPVS